MKKLNALKITSIIFLIGFSSYGIADDSGKLTVKMTYDLLGAKVPVKVDRARCINYQDGSFELTKRGYNPPSFTIYDDDIKGQRQCDSVYKTLTYVFGPQGLDRVTVFCEPGSGCTVDSIMRGHLQEKATLTSNGNNNYTLTVKVK